MFHTNEMLNHYFTNLKILKKLCAVTEQNITSDTHIRLPSFAFDDYHHLVVVHYFNGQLLFVIGPVIMERKTVLKYQEKNKKLNHGRKTDGIIPGGMKCMSASSTFFLCRICRAMFQPLNV